MHEQASLEGQVGHLIGLRVQFSGEPTFSLPTLTAFQIEEQL